MQTHSLKLRYALLAVGVLVLLAGIGMTLVRMQQQPAAADIDLSSLPNPFVQKNTTAATVSTLGKKGNFDVIKMTFDINRIPPESREDANPNVIYVMPSPDNPIWFLDNKNPIDVVLGGRENAYGYEYTTPNALEEKANANLPNFASRFPGKFFATAKALEEDAAHGNDLANFATRNGITWNPTDPRSSAAVYFKPNMLYVFVVNETHPVTINWTPIQVCGNAWVQTGEQCDDGNTTTGDGCSSICVIEEGYACTGNPSSCSSIKTPKKCASIPTIIKPNGDFVIDNDDPAGYRETGVWQTLAKGYKGTEREFDAFSPEVPSALWCATDLAEVTTYDVYATWKNNSPFNAKVAYEILNQTAVLSTVEANQSSDPTDISYDGVPWKLLDTINFKPGSVQVNIKAPVGTAALGDAVYFRKRPPPPVQVCGNGVREGTEECDDGNAVDNDECRNDCKLYTPIPF